MAGMATMGRLAPRATATGPAAPPGVRVSVVIPTYNRSASLQRLLRAVANSTVPAGGMEVVVVDDGSTDATAQVAAQAEVHCLTQPNYGPAAARERGWRSSTGEIVVFLDDDVVPEPDAIERMVDALDEADGGGAALMPLNPDPLIAHYMHVDGLVDHNVRDGEVRWLITAASAFKRSALERVGGFDLTFPRAAGEDVDLTLRLIEAGFRLRLETAAIVRHDHRSRFRQLLGTCYRYGTAYKLLASRHIAHRAQRLRNALLRLSPLEWRRLYLSYRRDASIARSVAFLGLHVLVVAPYAFGVLRGEGTRRGKHLVSDIDLAADETAVELTGIAHRPATGGLVTAEEGAPAA